MAAALVKHEQITTTLPKAKELRRYVEKLVTLGKRGDLHARRLLIAKTRDQATAAKLIDVLGPALRRPAGRLCPGSQGRLPLRRQCAAGGDRVRRARCCSQGTGFRAARRPGDDQAQKPRRPRPEPLRGAERPTRADGRLERPPRGAALAAGDRARRPAARGGDRLMSDRCSKRPRAAARGAGARAPAARRPAAARRRWTSWSARTICSGRRRRSAGCSRAASSARSSSGGRPAAARPRSPACSPAASASRWWRSRR